MTENEVDNAVERPTYLAAIHGAGVIFAVAALFIRGLDSPAVGFPIAITILIGLSIPSSPKPADTNALQIIHGSILQGGIRQGVFIKGVFALALLYMGARIYINTGNGAANLMLGTALAVSAIASEIEAWTVRKVVESSQRANQVPAPS